MLLFSRPGPAMATAASSAFAVSFAFAASFALMSSSILAPTSARAHGWSYHALDSTLGRVRSYLSRTYLPVRRYGDRRRARMGVLVMKLGLGIPYCKGHSATIAVREGKLFRPVAIARTLRGVRARNIGLMAVTLPPGTYHVVHGRCHVGRRIYNVGRPLAREHGRRERAHGRERGREHEQVYRAYRTSYAKFSISAGQILNAGFLRFFPPRRGRRGMTIRLQHVPQRDLRFLATRYPDLREGLLTRLMVRTNAAGYALNGGERARRSRSRSRSRRTNRNKKTIRRKTDLRKTRITPPAASSQAPRPASPTVTGPGSEPRDNHLPGTAKTTGGPVIRMPSPTPGHPRQERKKNSRQAPATGSRPLEDKGVIAATRPPEVGQDAVNGRKASTDAQAGTTVNSSMSLARRRAACRALAQLKKQGKVRELPLTCLRLGRRGTTFPEHGLPPARGADK